MPGMVHFWSTNAPSAPHRASWPSIHAVWVPVQADSGVSELNRLLYCWAWARLLASTCAGTVEVPVGTLVRAVGTPAAGFPVGWTVTVAVDVVVRDVVVVDGGGGGGDADDDGEAAAVVSAELVGEVEEEAGGGDGASDVVELAGCVLSGVVGTTTADVDAFEVGKAAGVVDVGVVVVETGASLVAAVVEDEIDVELEAALLVDAVSEVEAELVGAEVVGTAAEVVAPADVAVVFVSAEVWPSPPVKVGMALLVE